MEITMMTGTQIIVIVFGLFMVYLTFLYFKRKNFSRYQFIIWEILWVGLIIVMLMPNKFNNITEKLGIARAFDLFAIIAFVIILFLTFHNYSLIAKIEAKLEDRVRKKALEDLDKQR